MKQSEPNVAPESEPVWAFVLYRAEDTATGQRAEAVLRHLCSRHLSGRYTLEIVDVTDETAVVPADILAVPTVIRISPRPERRVIGDLSDIEKASRVLGLPAENFI